jgi:hypothetical protein
MPQTNNYLLVQIPVWGSDQVFYTLETRHKVGYDISLPKEGVIIHEVDLSRGNPANVLDIDGNGDTGDEGATWMVGETFQDELHGITVTINGASTTAYTISITVGPAPSYSCDN